MGKDDKDDLFQRWDDSAQDDLYGLDGDSPDFDADGIGWTLDDSHLPPPPEALAAIKAKMEGGDVVASLGEVKEDEEDADLGDFFGDLERNDAFGGGDDAFGATPTADAFGATPAPGGAFGATPAPSAGAFGATPAKGAVDLPSFDDPAPPDPVFDHNQAGLDPDIPSFGDLQRNSDAFIASSPTHTPTERPSPGLFEAPVLDSFAGVPVTGHGLEPGPDLDLDGDALNDVRESVAAAQAERAAKADIHPLDDFAARNPKPEHDGDFFADLANAPLFIIKKDGAILIGFATLVLMFAVVSAVGRSLFGGLISLTCYGIFYGYLMRITAASAEGAEKLPDFQDISSAWDDGFIPTFQVSVLSFVHAIPVFLVALVTTHPIALGLVGFVSMLFFPVSFLNLSMRSSLLDMRPAWQIKAIASAPSHYFAAAGGFAVGIGLIIAISLVLGASLDPEHISLGAVGIRYVLIVPAFVYASVLFAHVMGRFFFRTAQDLDLEG